MRDRGNVLMFLHVVLIALASVAQNSVAQNAVAQSSLAQSFDEQSSLIIRVRTLEASLPFSADPRRATSRPAVADGIRDLAQRLNEFHFKRFALLASHSKESQYGQTQELDLGDGHKLTYKPTIRGKDRVCLWLQWRDGSGMEVLNTRMNFKAGESVLTGVDKTERSGLVLAIDVQPGVVQGIAVQAAGVESAHGEIEQ